MKKLVACLVFSCGQVFAGPFALHEEAAVSGPFVRLSDISDTTELRELRIAYSPRPGRVLVLERADVQRTLDRHEAGLRLEGAERVTVRRVAHRAGVTRNQPVRVRVAFGAVAIETTAVANGDGRPGDVIRVRNPETDKTYLARVAGPGLVEALGR